MTEQEYIKNYLPKFEYIHNSVNIVGKSIPEDAKEGWKPLMEQLNVYVPRFKTYILNFILDGFNTSSSLYLNSIFINLETYVKDKEHIIIINWYYPEDDEDMFDYGEIYKDRFPLLKFNLIQR